MIASRLFLDKYFSKLITHRWNEENNLSGHFQVGTDTRSFIPGSVFIAIKGEVHDSFKYTKEILAQTPLVIFQNSKENNQLATEWSKLFPKTIFVAVTDTVGYLQWLARLHVEDWYQTTNKHHLIAISGSNGKTTTKEMLYHILKNIFGEKIIATKKNNNNHIGVPLTLFDIDSRSTQAAVVEFGSNHPGEMKTLCDLAIPNVGITTNIGHTHMEFFATLKDVFDEESLIFDAVMQQTNNLGIFLINHDDEYLKKLSHKKNTKSFSCFDADADYFYKMSGLNAMEVTEKGRPAYKVENLNITGEHNFINLCNAVVLAKLMFPDQNEQIKKQASTFKPTANRSQWLKYQNVEVFLDAYNANPSSIKAALKSFVIHCVENGLAKKDILVVLGEMKELGEKSAHYHRDLGQFVRALNLENIIYVGAFTSEFTEACENAVTFPSVDLAKETFNAKLKNCKKCFIKASRSLQLERLVDITKG